MVSILKNSGFKNLESLQEFSIRFPSIRRLDEGLEKIWICHKNPDDIPKFEEIHLLPSEDYYSLLNKVKKKINKAEGFLSLMTEFSPLEIFNKIYMQFKEQIATYLFTKCYIFYNWGINAFEPVLDHFEIHKQIEKNQKIPSKPKGKKIENNFFNHVSPTDKDSKKNHTKTREKSVDLFEETLGSFHNQTKSKVSFRAVRKAIQKSEKFFDLSKNQNSAFQETFNLKKILYDMKEKPQWPKKHVLSRGNVEELILFIIDVPVLSSKNIKDKLLNEHKNWVKLRELLGIFIKQHHIIDKNNGYGRILKKHINGKTHLEKKLIPIPKSIICSYITDILRRVIPLQLFGSNHVKKSFFKCLYKVLNGSKGQTFMWYSLLNPIIKKKSDLIWISELGDNYTQSQIILKLFKFLVIHYIFVILKNNFYVTETGSSGFGLRFYRKSDVESISFLYSDQLLKCGYVKKLTKSDYDQLTIEKKWVEAGKIQEEDLKKKYKKLMKPDSQYKQSLASVRFLPKNDDTDEMRLITNIPQNVPKCVNSENKKLEKLFTLRLSWRKKKLFFVKLLLDFLVDKYGFGIRPEPYNPVLKARWKKAIHLKETYGNLYFIKADISNAFGSVKYDILIKILKETLENDSHHGKIELMKIIEWRKARWRFQKAVRFSFSNRPKENSVMINRSVFLHHKKKINQYYDSTFLNIIKQVVMMQKVEIKGRVYKMVRGLAQGSAGRFSPQLCEFYYSFMDKLCFKEFINANDVILLRAVDDYLFITPDLGKAKSFLEIIQNGVKDFEVVFGGHKLKSNLIENVHEVSYLGLIFNFEDMSVKPDYSKYEKVDILSTINMFDQWGNIHFNKELFLQRRSLCMNCLKINPIVLNSVHDNLKLLRRTIFEACLIQSVRVITISNYIYSGRIKNDLVVYKILLKSCRKIKNQVASSVLSNDEVDWMFFFAAFNILKKRMGQFHVLFLIIKFHLQKCEKKFLKLGSELLLDFLKNDLLEKEYWNKLNAIISRIIQTNILKINK